MGLKGLTPLQKLQTFPEYKSVLVNTNFQHRTTDIELNIAP